MVEESQSVAEKPCHVENIDVEREALEAIFDLVTKLDESLERVKYISGYLASFVSGVEQKVGSATYNHYKAQAAPYERGYRGI